MYMYMYVYKLYICLYVSMCEFGHLDVWGELVATTIKIFNPSVLFLKARNLFWFVIG